LVKKTIRAAKQQGVDTVTASGGVTCNRGLREAMKTACQDQGLQFRLAQGRYCTDNAAMVGLLAAWKIKSGVPPHAGEEDIRAGWSLETPA